MPEAFNHVLMASILQDVILSRGAAKNLCFRLNAGLRSVGSEEDPAIWSHFPSP